MRKWLEFKLFKWLIRRHLEVYMDQHDCFKMKTSFGWGYVSFAMIPLEGIESAYRELK